MTMGKEFVDTSAHYIFDCRSNYFPWKESYWIKNPISNSILTEEGRCFVHIHFSVIKLKANVRYSLRRTA